MLQTLFLVGTLYPSLQAKPMSDPVSFYHSATKSFPVKQSGSNLMLVLFPNTKITSTIFIRFFFPYNSDIISQRAYQTWFLFNWIQSKGVITRLHLTGSYFIRTMILKLLWNANNYSRREYESAAPRPLFKKECIPLLKEANIISRFVMGSDRFDKVYRKIDSGLFCYICGIPSGYWWS